MRSNTAPRIVGNDVPRGAPQRALSRRADTPMWRRLLRRFRGSVKRMIAGDPGLYPAPRELRPRASSELVPNRIKLSAAYDGAISPRTPLGRFAGRPIIGGSSPIHGGVVVTEDLPYALVIDEKYGLLEDVFRSLTAAGHSMKARVERSELRLVAELFSVVHTTVPLDRSGIAKLLDEKRFAADEKVALDVFISARVGQPIHQVVLAGYLIEKLIHGGVIGGEAALQLTGSAKKLIYTASNGKTTRFEPAALEEAADPVESSE